VTRRIWLASYPKSGNTWLRILLANLSATDAPVRINHLTSDEGIASSRQQFDYITMLESGLMHHDEVALLRPAAHISLPRLTREERDDAGDEADSQGDGARYVKTHDAYTLNPAGEPLLGGMAAAAGAVLVVRDPRDVAPSLANHNGTTVDEAIATMANADNALCAQTDLQPNQLRQTLLDWSAFNASWLDQTDLPLLLLRYEDMQADIAAVVRRLLDFGGRRESDAQIARAVAFADFEELRAQEREEGFREAPRGSFFRRGKAGGWREELTEDQVRRIERRHRAMMVRLGYAPEYD